MSQVYGGAVKEGILGRVVGMQKEMRSYLARSNPVE
jgi:hypothetical protein